MQRGIARTSEFLIRAGALDGFRDYVLELGGDPRALFRQAGLPPDVDTRPEVLIPVDGFRRILNSAAEATGVDHFGLDLSQRQSLAKLGAVGYLASHSKTLRHAVRMLGRHLEVHDTASYVLIEESPDICLWRFDQADGSDEPRIQQVELALGLAVKFVRSVLRPDWNPQVVYLQHARPRDAAYYARVLRCPVQFRAPLDGLDVTSDDMDRALVTSDPGLHRVLRNHLALLDTQQRRAITGRVRAVVLEQIGQGAVTLEQAAARLSLSRTSLQRALRSEGKSYQSLLDEIRFALACRYLRGSDTPLAEIALKLGYSESAVFTRAFKRISGQTPSDWRRQNRASGPRS
ncbi:MAG: AraC family transcriptional regulator [Pikeienuella sp.]